MFYIVFWLVLVVVCTTTMVLFVKVVFGVPAWRLMHYVSVQYSSGFLPDIIILLTQCYYYRGTHLNAMKRFFVFAAYDPT